jgi:hypothetical protein
MATKRRALSRRNPLRERKRNPLRITPRVRRAARLLVKRYHKRARTVAGRMIGAATTSAQREHFAKIARALKGARQNPKHRARNPAPHSAHSHVKIFAVYQRSKLEAPWELVAATPSMTVANRIAATWANDGFYVRITDGQDS